MFCYKSIFRRRGDSELMDSSISWLRGLETGSDPALLLIEEDTRNDHRRKL